MCQEAFLNKSYRSAGGEKRQFETRMLRKCDKPVRFKMEWTKKCQGAIPVSQIAQLV